MYKKIMVPLDGSELAECVLPHVEAIARGCGVGSVTFVRAVEPINLPSGVAYISEDQKKEMDARNEVLAKDYLSQVASRVKLDGAAVQAKVIAGKAADSLADYANRNDFDLIIIATHGRSGISRWVWGSIADRILRSACLPVMMIRVPGCEPGI